MLAQNKVLLIDDEAPLLFGLKTIMQRQGYQVITAKNGMEGYQLAQDEFPDLIISDVMMPSPNGFELRDMLNENQNVSRIPFIFLTAKIEQEDKIKGIQGGADDYITKPFDREELIARVEAILRRTKIERDYADQAARQDLQQEMETLKQEVMRNVRHELRTPLVNVMLPLELAISNKFDQPIDQVNFIKVALANAERLQSLVEDFILLSDIDLGNLNTLDQEIYFDTNILPAIKKRLALYKDKKLSLNLKNTFPGRFLGPRNEIKRAVLHLVDNAYKFSPDGGKVDVKVFSMESDEIIILVSDQGPGIPQELREQVFEKFYQFSQGDSKKYQGLGVGLTISRDIARALGGDVVFLESELGASVALKLPLRTVPEPVFAVRE